MNDPTIKPRSRTLHRMIISAVFAAIIFATTAYLPRIPFAGGYVHIGDAFIYLAAGLLPMPWAMAAGAVGGALADALTGYMLWAPGTALIKAVTAMLFTAKKEKLLCKHNLVGALLSVLVCMGGYYIWETILTGSLVTPIASLFYNFLQGALSGVIYIPMAAALDKLNFKQRIMGQ
ncbi:MAG: TIGR04002 family protein [Clostridia bacterium]|nr:TIGR04002 family protein [Clostridia bacterium]